MTEVLLSARRLTKRFGGLAAVNDVTLDLWRDRIHAVIGPNGAGKSTLTNLLSRDLVPTVAKRLSMFVLRSKLKISDVSESWAQFGEWRDDGPSALEVREQDGRRLFRTDAAPWCPEIF